MLWPDVVEMVWNFACSYVLKGQAKSNFISRTYMETLCRMEIHPEIVSFSLTGGSSDNYEKPWTSASRNWTPLMEIAWIVQHFLNRSSCLSCRLAKQEADFKCAVFLCLTLYWHFKNKLPVSTVNPPEIWLWRLWPQALEKMEWWHFLDPNGETNPFLLRLQEVEITLC